MHDFEGFVQDYQLQNAVQRTVLLAKQVEIKGFKGMEEREVIRFIHGCEVENVRSTSEEENTYSL